MDDLHRPAEATSEAFGKLVLKRSILEFNTTSNRDISRHVHVSPRTIGEILMGRFPGHSSVDSEWGRTQFIRGRIASVARICATLKLDLDACLEACGLPKNELAIHRGQLSDMVTALNENDLKFLLKMVEQVGPLPPKMALALIGLERRKECLS